VVEQYESVNLALFLRAMSALSFMAGERKRYVVKLPCVRLIIVGGMLSEVFRGHGHVIRCIQHGVAAWYWRPQRLN
jgi:hypothetical protein